MKRTLYLSTVAAILSITGCQAWMVSRTDRDVYRLIENRQGDALGETSEVKILPGDDLGSGVKRMYSLTPRPVDPTLPDTFGKTRSVVAPSQTESDESPGSDSSVAPSEEADDDSLITPEIFTEEQLAQVTVFGLNDTLAYAVGHARALQNAKEDLYLAALALTLERHLWTPQLVASLSTTYDDFDDLGSLDRALTTVSQVAATQRLPFGGEVGARFVHTLLRDVTDHISKGESGRVIINAELPLLRGAGRTAYESRYAAERELIYAIRRYERFRRSFLVDVASEYFNLQQSKALINNTYVSYLNRKQDWEKADFIHRKGRSRNVFEAPRAKANFRDAEATLVSAKERYESSLDRFKIRLGMPIETLLDVIRQDQDKDCQALDALLPEVDETTAFAVALRYRLDLLNSADRVDDAGRGVVVAKNRILPDLILSGSATLNSNPDQLDSLNFSRDQTQWQGMVNLSIDDRKTEINSFRASQISQRRSERDHEEFTDLVRSDVRRAIRRIAEKDNVRTIRRSSVSENERYLDAARAQYDLGKSTNQAVVDAENDLLRARNEYSAAVAAYRVAILELRRDTGTLRTASDGRLVSSVEP